MENGNPIHGNVGKHRHRTVGFGVNPNDGKAYCAVCGKRITSVSTSGIVALAISLMLVLVLLTLFGPLTVKALEFFMNPLLAVLVLALALILDMRFGRCYCEGEELDKKRLELDKLLGGLSALSLGSLALIFSVAKYNGLDTAITAVFGFAVAAIGVGSMAGSANYAEQPKLTLLFAVGNDIITLATIVLTWENVWLAALPLLLILAQIPAAVYVGKKDSEREPSRGFTAVFSLVLVLLCAVTIYFGGYAENAEPLPDDDNAEYSFEISMLSSSDKELYDELRTQFGYICSDTLADEMAYNYAWLYNDGRMPTLEFESVCFTTVKTEYIGKDEPVTQKFVVVNTPERQSYWLMFSNGTLQAIYEGTPYGERLFMVIK